MAGAAPLTPAQVQARERWQRQGPQPTHVELAALQAQLRSIERRLGALAETTRADPGDGR
jgi:hypothetical protein